MSQSPDSTPLFSTPSRAGKHNESGPKHTPPTASPEYQLRSSQPRSPSGAKHVTIEISRRSPARKAYHAPQFDTRQILEQLYSKYENLSAQELMEVIATYQTQIEDLKLYIYQSDLLDRSKIGQIFGFGDGYRNSEAVLESRQVLKELSHKIKQLLKQNSALKDQNTRILTTREITTFRNTSDDHLLIKQNQKLRAIIDEYKSSEDR